MNNRGLHYKKNNLNLYYLGCSILLIIYGFYKNGILLYNELNSSIYTLFKPLLFPIISITIPLLINIIKNKNINISLNDNNIYLLLLSLCIPINLNIFIFIGINIIFTILLELVIPRINLNINYLALFKVIIIILLFILHSYNYANALEIANKYSYNLLDIFFGRGISGICCSSMIFIFISFIILSTNFYYKKEIPFISFIIYFALSLFLKLLFNKVIIINSLILYSLVFVAPINEYSPAGLLEKNIYSILVGLLTFIFTYYVNMYDGVIFAILLSSFVNHLNIK